MQIACPDCLQSMPARAVYVGQGRWVFEFSCNNEACENFQYQYQGEIHEIDMGQPTQKEISAALAIQTD